MTDEDPSDAPAESTDPGEGPVDHDDAVDIDGDNAPVDHDDDDADATDTDTEFAERLSTARSLLTDDATALYVGVVRDGREVDSTFAQRAGDARQEGMQALSLLASHLRLVADEAGVDYETVAGDAATLAARLDEDPADGDD